MIKFENKFSIVKSTTIHKPFKVVEGDYGYYVGIAIGYPIRVIVSHNCDVPKDYKRHIFKGATIDTYSNCKGESLNRIVALYI